MLEQYHKYHFVGIGGIGMCGLAEILHYQGYQVTGSDLAPSDNTRHLASLGIPIFYGHREENIGQAQMVIYTSAAAPDNPELLAAKARGIPILKRAELLGLIFNRYTHRIAVSGTHGKSTTTGLVASIFTKAQKDPLVIGGGISRDSQSPIRLGRGDCVIVEADEFDRSFLQLHPTCAVITTIEAEHLDCYGTFQAVKEAFIQFAQQVEPTGALIICHDEPGIREIKPNLERKVYTYGLTEPADFLANNITLESNGANFDVYAPDLLVGEFRLQLTGLHNVKNALAAIAVARWHGVSWQVIRSGLNQFPGIHRRMEVVYQSDRLLLMDDYAHHPTEIEATLRAIRRTYRRRVIAVFQPHLYSRTRDFAAAFAQALQLADIVILTEIYPAREKPIPGVTSRLIFDHLWKANAYYVKSLEEATSCVQHLYQPGDLIVTLGAGNVNQILPELKTKLGQA